MRGSALLVTVMMALAAIVSTSPVELEKRQRFPFGEVLLASYSYDSATTKFSGFLWVKNIAFQKIVQVYYSDPKVIWSPTQSVNAVYLAGPDPRGYEYWTFSAENVPNFGPGSVFYLRYAVAGQVFFDNNEFRNYVISGGDTVITTAPVTSLLGHLLPPLLVSPQRLQSAHQLLHHPPPKLLPQPQPPRSPPQLPRPQS
ncbi:hypothetical protein BC829DRAFT_454734 [Chytridium lagenaria]|nr:hypothetical protein BC829DRAFT_454734 [Chytridium lagenaria]